MSELEIGPGLVGSVVRAAARPEWGDGKVLKVTTTNRDGATVHRVQVHFPSGGTRWLTAPPARLIAPTAEPSRDKGWIDALGKSTLDDRLRKLPEDVTEVLASPRDRLAAVVPLFAVTDESKAVLRWARDQTGIADPLGHWSKDELLVALNDFRAERDSYFRNVAALLVKSEGRDALAEFVAQTPQPLRDELLEVLRRII